MRYNILLVFVLTFNLAYTQSGNQLKSIISIENRHLIAKINNPFRIVVQQNEPVKISQLNATFQEYNKNKVPIKITEGNGWFNIYPDTIGIVEVNIEIGDTLETKTLRVRPIEAVGRLGRYKANTDKKISAGELKAQMGIVANVECCGFDARCKVMAYQIIRISNKGEIEKTINEGSKFQDETIEVIANAESEDLYIFRQIKYICPGSNETQRLDDMIFEIK